MRPPPSLQVMPRTAATPHPTSHAHSAPSAETTDEPQRQACRNARNQDGTSLTNPNYYRAATGTASVNCRPGTRTEMVSTYRLGQNTISQIPPNTATAPIRRMG